MKCHTCKSEMICDKTVFHYRESGLEYVYLEGVDVYRCTGCDEEIINIPNIPDLHNFIGVSIIKKDSPLTGAEIRFLRKNAGMSALLMAEYMGVDNATISRWENGKQDVTPSHDRLVRLIYSEKKRIGIDIIDSFKNIRKERSEFRLNIPPEDWNPSRLT